MTDDTVDLAITISSSSSETEEPVVHDDLISKGGWYYVLGEWTCLECENKWSHKRTKIHLSKYKDGIDADGLQNNELVNQQCRKCFSKNSNLVKYSPLQSEDIKPLIHENLIQENKGNKWYRVYGTWKCNREDCKKGWASAHTYILLSQYLAQVPATELVHDVDYWGQDCTTISCTRGTLIGYRHLRMLGWSKNRIDPNHKESHCHKCRANFTCV
jgi:hypothetical protein